MVSSRLDIELVKRKLVASRSQAESYIKLGHVKLNGRIVTKAASRTTDRDTIEVTTTQQYVSRAALKLASVADALGLDFNKKVVLDVGSSTGGFTDFALRQGASKVIAVEVGTNQLHPSLKGNPKIELHEQTDIRSIGKLSSMPDIVVIDVSFISVREILPHVAKLVSKDSQVIAMVKPQFEAANESLKHKGVIKNDKIRREILRSFEDWVQKLFIIDSKADSDVPGAKGNQERFYKLVVSSKH